jgi:hypothetical protein
MKKTRLIILLAMLMSIVRLNAVTYTYNGINYDLDESKCTASVISNSYSGDIIIPSTIMKSSTTYTVKSIGRNAFKNCTNLNSVTIASSVTTIEDFAFQGCNLSSIVIPNSVTTIGYNAFRSCTSLTTISFGNSLTTIDEGAFMGCKALTSISLPNSLNTIGRWAFYGCKDLTNVNIPRNVISIGGGAFSRCLSITVDSNNKKYDSRNNCNAVVETASNTLIAGCQNTIITNDITTIGNYAFDGCIGINSIIIPSNIAKIGISAFEGCNGLTSFTIPGTVNIIDQYAFRDCKNLTSVIIENGVSTIGQYAFNGCSSLIDVIINIITPPNLLTATFSNCSNATLYVPLGSKSAYEAADNWKDFKEIMEMKDDITIGAAGIGTFCSTHALDFSGTDDIKAYIVSAFKPSTGEVTLTRITDVPANTGIVVKGDADTYSIPWGPGETIVSNMLVGVTENTILNKEDGDYTNYILAKKNGNLGFYAVADCTTLSAGKAYLPLPTASLPSGSGARSVKFVFDDEQTTDITEVESTKPDVRSEVYDLQGRKVRKPVKGLYIVNGKKVTIK